MRLLPRLILCLAVIFQFSHYPLSGLQALAADSVPDGRITRHEPQTRISNLKDLPHGGGSWLWGILGVVLIAGGAAALAGGGGGGGGDNDDDDVTTGSVGGSW